MMALKGNRTYTGDTADYGVEIVSVTKTVAKVRIVQHDSPECTIPLGVVIAVPVSKLI